MDFFFCLFLRKKVASHTTLIWSGLQFSKALKSGQDECASSMTAWQPSNCSYFYAYYLWDCLASGLISFPQQAQLYSSLQWCLGSFGWSWWKSSTCSWCFQHSSQTLLPVICLDGSQWESLQFSNVAEVWPVLLSLGSVTSVAYLDHAVPPCLPSSFPASLSFIPKHWNVIWIQRLAMCTKKLVRMARKKKTTHFSKRLDLLKFKFLERRQSWRNNPFLITLSP